ncbi:MAG: response regulator transcription factor [Dyadobacter sp.]|uniref:LytR/AlgR family response regulator transcription factor n=1 Tax=Dyadobacter sp. TaxID=1914288 RepID=UPI001B2AEE12|nr:LytTR family DNA-binding domain-containing protein [Dyadobacter sp.]MBO9616539.1 response regulator transcription factor [Dyadobacter sp.]
MTTSKIRCLIVDDEPLAISVLQEYISQLETLTLVGTCCNAVEALLFLQKNKVDLLFLDIQMPKLTGIDFLKTLANRPKVIFTTAYREYALEGFELNVLDYLLKPVPFDRFLLAINKYHGNEPANKLPQLLVPANENGINEQFIYLKSDKKMIKVFLNEILYIESLKDYVKVKTVSGDVVSYQRISYLEEKLPDRRFLRIHRAYIIATDKIRSFNTSVIEVGGQELPIGRQYKADVMKVLGMP